MINSEYICSKRARSHYYSARVLFFSHSDSHVEAVNRQLLKKGFKVSVKERIKMALSVCVGETIVKS